MNQRILCLNYALRLQLDFWKINEHRANAAKVGLDNSVIRSCCSRSRDYTANLSKS
ncbi:uncharacterized protein Dmoj_GI26340 [Drosophila mojavensis]|uniref:Uncharacterized protein n=1 Tax=Drosophila mojavensis TaxID=7230 RepID=A0A0Q9X749_DROMO|nr:uncharacterized protein Dmoj_GI26340 [Drosophila mojavensis]